MSKDKNHIEENTVPSQKATVSREYEDKLRAFNELVRLLDKHGLDTNFDNFNQDYQ